MINTFSDTTKKYYLDGKVVENNFANDLIASEGGFIVAPSKTDDIKNHIDLFWVKNDKSCSFDVKGVRKKSRYDTSVSYDTTWLELKNVNGLNGSLLGKQDYMAFEMKDEWVIVRRKSLLLSLLKMLSDKTIYNTNPNEDYKLYQRSGRQDLIVRVPYSFIIANSVKKISKNI